MQMVKLKKIKARNFSYFNKMQKINYNVNAKNEQFSVNCDSW